MAAPSSRAGGRVRGADLEPQLLAVRSFNRFYTRQIGLLNSGYLKSPFSLTEVRVLYELAALGTTTATRLREDLALDAGYLSRILASFKKRGLISQTPSPLDRRQTVLSLSRRGKEIFRPLNRRSQQQIGAMVRHLSAEELGRLTGAMRAIESLLGSDPLPRLPIVLRPHRAGDMGWVVHRHGVLYAQEYGWNEQFEALVATIVARFLEHYDARRERCWIAERGGEAVGCLFVVKQSSTVARLRLMLVEPRARGLGIGSQLVNECLGFARAAGYRKIVLWTNSVLTDARRIYQKAGFYLVHEEAHHSFGHDLVGQTWELTL